MTALQGGDVVTSQHWTGIARRPWYRRPERLAAVVLLAALALGTVTWWLVVHGVPELQVRVDSAKLRSVELPPGFEEAPWSCPSSTLVCAWSELEPKEAATALSARLAEAGLGLPEVRCGTDSPVLIHSMTQPTFVGAPGSCSASRPSHGATLAVIAQDRVPFAELDGAPVEYPRTLVTAGWVYSSMGPILPGAVRLEDIEVLVSPEEIAELPVALEGAVCSAECLVWDLALPTGPDVQEAFRQVLDETLAAGLLVEHVECKETGHCEAHAVSSRPAHPDESLRYWLEIEGPSILSLRIQAWS